MIHLAFGLPEWGLILIVPVIFFFIGYSVGKKSGYIKRVKEQEKFKQGS
jgi:hypothetical protein